MFEQRQVIQLNVNVSCEMFRNLPGYIQFEQQADAFFYAKDLANEVDYQKTTGKIQYGMNFSESVWSSFVNEINKIIKKEFEDIIAPNTHKNMEKVVYTYFLSPHVFRFESYHQHHIDSIHNFLTQALPILSKHYLNMNQCDKWCDENNEHNLVYGVNGNEMTFFFNDEIVQNYKKVLLNAKLENELPENSYDENQIKKRGMKL